MTLDKYVSTLIRICNMGINGTSTHTPTERTEAKLFATCTKTYESFSDSKEKGFRKYRMSPSSSTEFYFIGGDNND